MAVENELERPVGWYVSRVVNVPAGQAGVFGLLGGVVTPDGATLQIGDPIKRELPMEDHRSYAATLAFPGVLAAKLKVELVVTRYSGSLVEVGLRPFARVPQRRVGAQRYFEAAWAVLDALAAQDLKAVADGGAAREAMRFTAGRPARKLARAS
jgi:hypothetical protein